MEMLLAIKHGEAKDNICLPLLYQLSLNGKLKQIFYIIVKPFSMDTIHMKKLVYPCHLHKF